MTVCPVCAHPQLQGVECEVCGKALIAARPLHAPVAPLPELERTAFAPANGPAAPPLPDLETTRLVSGPDLPQVRVVDVEWTAFSPAGAVSVETMGDLDRGRHVDDGPRTALPLIRVCRYCKNTQAEGSTCDRCGMLLPGEGFTPKAAPSATSGETIKCLQCGSRVVVGEICGGCGIVA